MPDNHPVWNADRVVRVARSTGLFIVERFSDRDARKRRAMRKAAKAGLIRIERHGSSHLRVCLIDGAPDGR